MSFLRTTRKSDRRTMANAIKKLAVEFGYEYTEREEERDIYVCVKTERGLSVSMNFHPNSRGYLGHWFISGTENSDVALAAEFETVGSRNPYHFHKATTYANNFMDFEDVIRTGFEMVKNGIAFK